MCIRDSPWSGTTQNWLPWQRPLRNRKNWIGFTSFTLIPYLPFGAKIVKISAVDPEIALLKLKKETTEGKIYSPSGKFAERAKKHHRVYLKTTVPI